MTSRLAQGDESRQLARGGVVSFAGSATSALLGFVLTVVLARTLGDAGSGVVLQAIAVFTIGLAVARAGMDSAAVWIMPRLAQHEPGRLRATLLLMLTTAAVAGIVVAAGIALALQLIAPGDSTDPGDNGDVVAAVRVVLWFLPAGAVMLVALAATRGLGGILPYVAIGGVALSAARPVAVLIAVAVGGSLTTVALAWALPVPAALLAAATVLAVQLGRHENGNRGTWRIQSAERRRVFGYALPRTISAALEQSVMWLDVIVVGAVAGPAAAGIYGAASRFIAAGLVVDSALRVVVSTRFSALLFDKRLPEVEALYRSAATWLVLFGTPVYLILAIFAPVVLGVLGHEFVRGSTALAILCAGAILTFLAGNVHSLLLMSGRSGWGALNKVCVVIVNVVGNLLMIPVWGIEGAAVVWAASMLLDAALATIEVRVLVGIRLTAPSVAYALLIAVVSVGVPAGASRLIFGATATGFWVGLTLAIVAFLGWIAADRRRLGLHELRNGSSNTRG
ncbi:MAG: oligosaccharide flippase family protein [Microbacteriaceae bacterium]